MFAPARRFLPTLPTCSVGFGGALEVQQRNAATLKTIKARIQSVKGIQKITKAMKMVSAAKMRKDAARMEQGLPFCKPVQQLFDRLPQPEDNSGAVVYMPITSDKGLCGGVNTFVAKQVRLGIVAEEAKGQTGKVMCVGNKGVAALKRQYGDRFTHSFEEVVKAPWTFLTASLVAERLIQVNPARLNVVSNKFRNMVSYDTEVTSCVTKQGVKTMDKPAFSKAMDAYSFEPAVYEVWDDLHEFYYGTLVYGAYLEGAVCEQSSRMGAMENASKNAGEMIGKLELIYNRARQAKITTELCEIISGAAAVS